MLRIVKEFKLILFCFLYVGLSIQAAWSAPFNFSGNWRTLTTQKEGYIEAYQQSYNLNFRQDISEVMKLQESFRYSRSWRDDEGSRETYNPSLNFLVVNDIFRFELNGNATKNRNTERSNTTSSSWQGIWQSTWQNEMWPKIQFDFGQSFAEDDESPSLMDTKNDEWGGGVDWDIDYARLVYNYSWREITDKANDSDNTIRTNFARFDTDGSLWDNRLSLTFSQQFSNDRRDFSIDVPPSGTVLVPVSLGQVAAGIDDTPEESALTPVPGLNDGNIEVSALSSDPLNLNISLKTDLQNVNLIYVYTVEDLALTLGIVEVNSFRWDLFSSNDSLNWKLEQTNLSYTYNSLQKRFEIDITDLQKVHIKLVAVDPTPTGTEVDFSEVEAFNEVLVQEPTFSLHRETLNYLTNANIGFSFNEDMNFLYSLSFDKRHNSDAPNQQLLSHLGAFTWILSPTLTTSLSINETRSEIGDLPEDTNRSYGINFLSSALPTLDMNFGVTRREIYSDSSKLSTSDSFNFYATAAIFPALDLSFDSSYSITDNEETDETTKFFENDLTLTARINPKLTVDFRNEYDNTKSEDNSSDVLSSSLGMSWRLSDMLLLQFTALGQFDSDEDDDLGLRLNMAMVPAEEIQFDVTYIILDSGGETTQRTAMTFGWTIGQYFILRAAGDYRDNVDEDDWRVTTELVMRFNGF